MITHYQRLLDYIKPDVVHVLYKGRIVKTAGPELALELEEKGYDWIKKEMEMSNMKAEQQYIDLFAQCEDLVCRHSTPVMNALS